MHIFQSLFQVIGICLQIKQIFLPSSNLHFIGRGQTIRNKTKNPLISKLYSMSENDKSKQQKVIQGKKDQNMCLGRGTNAEYNFK